MTLLDYVRMRPFAQWPHGLLLSAFVPLPSPLFSCLPDWVLLMGCMHSWKTGPQKGGGSKQWEEVARSLSQATK